MSAYLKEKFENLVKRFNSEMEEAVKFGKSHEEIGHYTPEHIDVLVKEEKEKIKNKFLSEAKSLLTEIKKSSNDFHSSKLKSLFPNINKESDSFGQFKLNGELQIQDGNRRAQEVITNNSSKEYDLLVNELNEASMLGRIDFVSQVLNKLQPIFDQLNSQFTLKPEEQKLVDYKNNHLKKTGAQDQIEKLQSNNYIEEKAKLFVSEVWHGSEHIFIPDKDSNNGTDNLLRYELEERLSSTPNELFG